jgi:hypothetical protein
MFLKSIRVLGEVREEIGDGVIPVSFRSPMPEGLRRLTPHVHGARRQTRHQGAVQVPVRGTDRDRDSANFGECAGRHTRVHHRREVRSYRTILAAQGLATHEVARKAEVQGAVKIEGSRLLANG